MKSYLPIGSVVLLTEGDKRVMIYGRRQSALVDGAPYDYIACLYPEGNIDEQHTYLFNHDQIERVYYLGMQDEEELYFQEVLAALDRGE